MDEKQRKQFLAGAVLVAVGGLLILQQVTKLAWLEWSHFWPIIIIAMGINQVLQGWARGDGKAGWGLSSIIVGLVLMLHTQQILPLTKGWPLIVVGQGLGLVLNGRWAVRRGPEVPHDR